MNRLLLIGLVLFSACKAQPTVTRVVDGDTVVLSDGTHMRLAGIDCPESKRNAKCQRSADCETEVVRGQAVSKEVRSLAVGGQAEVIGTEKYGRALGYVWLGDGRDLGQWLTATGRCANVGDQYPHPRAKDYK